MGVSVEPSHGYNGRASPPRPRTDTPVPRRRRRWLTRTFASLALSWGAALAVNRSLRDVTGPSMLPTLAPGDRLLVLPTWLRPARRGDVVVLRDQRPPAQSTVKRIVGLPGEAIELRDGALTIDGVAHHEPYLDPATAGGDDVATVVGDDRVYVLGDGRDASTDSRGFGAVPSRLIAGVVVAVIAPRPRLVLRRAPERR